MALRYRIAALGWYNFETLVQTLLKVVIGPGVTSFGGTKDGGRDAVYQGTANFPSSETQWSGKWVFQVKYVEAEGDAEGRRQLTRTFKDECKSISRRRRSRAIANYILITNVAATASFREELAAELAGVLPVQNFALVDGREICEFLDIYPAIRRAYPQLLGLADLNHIVNKGLYVRSEAFVNQWQPRLSTFVRTSIYDAALDTLAKKHFVVLDGPPESGKSTIAAAIALLYAGEGAEVIELIGADDFFRAHDPDVGQIFIADDAVGSISTSYP